MLLCYLGMLNMYQCGYVTSLFKQEYNMSQFNSNHLTTKSIALKIQLTGKINSVDNQIHFTTYLDKFSLHRDKNKISSVKIIQHPLKFLYLLLGLLFVFE